MKRKSFLLISACALLAFGGLASCSIPEVAPEIYTVSDNSPTDYSIVGLDSEGYEAGEKVLFGVVSKDGTTDVDLAEVRVEGASVTHEGGNLYSFVMPATNVKIEVTLGLDAALAKAQTGAAFDSIFTEKQTYIDNSGEISSKSRYARRVTATATNEYNLVTRYKSVYDYDEANFDNNVPIDVSKTEADTIYMFAKKPETTHLATTALDMNNTLAYSDVLDSATEANLDWYSTFNNPFSLLDADDFEADATEVGVYHLKTGDPSLNPVKTSLAQIIFGDIQLGYKVDEFSVKVVNGEFTEYSGTFADPAFEMYKSEVSFTGTFTGFGETVFETPTTLEGEVDEDLEDALADLRKGNYTVTVTEKYTNSFTQKTTVDVTRGRSDGGEHFLQEIFATDADIATAEPAETYFYNQLTVYDDFMERDEYSVEQAVKIRNEYFKFSSDREDVRILTNMLPQFNFSSLFFKKDGDKYVLKTAEELPYYAVFGTEELFSPFTTLSLRNLEITIGDDAVTFVTDDTYGTITTVSYTNIGSTTIEEITINETTEKLTKWEDFFKNDAITTQATSTIPSEIINLVPVPRVSYGGSVANVTPAYFEVDEEAGTRSMQIVCALDSFGDMVDLQYDDLLVLFSQGLSAQGFDYDESDTSQYLFRKRMNVLGVDSDVEISLGGYGTYFVVEYNIEKHVEPTPEA